MVTSCNNWSPSRVPPFRLPCCAFYSTPRDDSFVHSNQTTPGWWGWGGPLIRLTKYTQKCVAARPATLLSQIDFGSTCVFDLACKMFVLNMIFDLTMLVLVGIWQLVGDHSNGISWWFNKFDSSIVVLIVADAHWTCRAGKFDSSIVR